MDWIDRRTHGVDDDFAGDISGTLVKVIWHGNGYMIGLFDAPAVSDVAISVKGNMLAPQPGMGYNLTGKVVRDKRYGPAFVFDEYQAVYPTDSEAVRLYLQQNVKWIGPAIARRITDAFGDDALEVCREDPARVAEEIRGITAARAEEISAMLIENLRYESIQVNLKKLFQGIAVPRRLIDHLIKRFDTEAYEAVRQNPYMLTGYSGVGFARADQIAQRLNFDTHSPLRIRAGISHVMDKAANDGHTYLPVEEAVANSENLLALDAAVITAELFTMPELETGMDLDRPWVAQRKLYEAEEEFAKTLLTLLEANTSANTPKETAVDESLAQDQRVALQKALDHHVFILTGAPGTGKTYTVKRIIQSIPGHRVALAAPTGKAAARLAEMTGREVVTIHRLLEPRVTETDEGPKFEFQRNRVNPIEESLVIIDEASMIDVSLACSLIRAIAKGTRLIFVGDVHQLPSVGPGNVLKDMIAAGVPSAELTEIKRQDAGLIVHNCHRVKDGRPVQVDNSPGSDFFISTASDTSNIRTRLVALLKSTRLQDAFGADPIRDCQVLSPLRTRGDLCCDSLNELLQSELNHENKAEGERFWPGDKVIQLKNDYDLGIINGDIGYVDVYQAGGKMCVSFENPTRYVSLHRKRNDLALAYTVTVHKYQGSESPVVIMPAHKSLSSPICQRNLIYTAISRAQRAFIAIGEIEFLHRAVKKNDALRRYTRLKGMIDGNEA